MTRRWLLADSGGAGGSGVTGGGPSVGLAADTGLAQRILHSRGLVDDADVERFRHPRLSHLHDPSLLPGVDAAAARLIDALRARERIVIYGDYDVDGVTATAILHHTIKAIEPDADVGWYIPHRIDEGYGINSDALRQLRHDGASLVISVDCGVTAIEPAAVAREIGLDLIVTDHHRLSADEALPDAVAVVHPALPALPGGSAYPFGELCGAGVAFKLAWRLATMWSGSERVGSRLQQTLLNMLPLAALGTIADVVPLVDENRIIATHGLQLIKRTPILGLRALIEASDLAGENITCENVGFVLGPRLNACGRMGHAAEAVQLLVTNDASEAEQIARSLAALNRERQQTEKGIVEQAARMAEDRGMTADDRRIIVLADPSWHPGVVGIVCSRLTERFGRPAILMQLGQDECRGSARSIDGYSIHDAICACAEHVVRYGGHDAAAGLTVDPRQLDQFINAITDHANGHIQRDQLVPSLRVDCSASLADLDFDSVSQVRSLSPFGRANPKPSVLVESAVIAETPRQIGAHGSHLCLRLRQDAPGGRSWLRTVWWRGGSHAQAFAPGMHVDVVIEPTLNTWNGRTSVEAVIKDVRVCEASKRQPE